METICCYSAALASVPKAPALYCLLVCLPQVHPPTSDPRPARAPPAFARLELVMKDKAWEREGRRRRRSPPPTSPSIPQSRPGEAQPEGGGGRGFPTCANLHSSTCTSHRQACCRHMHALFLEPARPTKKSPRHGLFSHTRWGFFFLLCGGGERGGRGWNTRTTRRNPTRHSLPRTYLRGSLAHAFRGLFRVSTLRLKGKRSRQEGVYPRLGGCVWRHEAVPGWLAGWLAGWPLVDQSIHCHCHLFQLELCLSTIVLATRTPPAFKLVSKRKKS